MQRKFIKIEQLAKYILPDEEVIFLDSSPTRDITLPPRTVLVAIHGTQIGLCGYQGTVYVGRNDSNSTVLLDVDAYSFNSDADSEGNIEVVGPIKVRGLHHSNDIPDPLKTGAPNRVVDRLEEISSGNLSDSNFIS